MDDNPTTGTARQDRVPVIAQQPQRQDSLQEQLRDLQVVANRLGMYDAADWISDRISPAAFRGIIRQ